MKKTIILTFLISIIFSGCFSFSSINPFSSDDNEEEKQSQNLKEISIPDDAPKWLKSEKNDEYILALGIAKNVKKEQLNFYKKQAILNAGSNLARKIYIKTVNIYKEYEESLDNPSTFTKDIEDVAKQISLQSLNISKIKHSWLSSKNTLFVQVGITCEVVGQKIQTSSKKLFKVDKALYKHFLSNIALRDLCNKLKREDG